MNAVMDVSTARPPTPLANSRFTEAVSCPVTRPSSPLGEKPKLKAASAPSSRRGSFTSKKKLPPLPPRASADVLLRRSAAATIGTAPTGRGEIPREHGPGPMSYNAQDIFLSKRRAAPSATFGTAAPRTDPRQKLPAISFAGPDVSTTQLPHSFHATFGTASTVPQRRNLCSVHSYLDHATATPFKSSQSATIGLAKPLRPSSGCKVHSYQSSQPKGHTFHATFGTESRFGPRGVRSLGLPMQPALVAAA